MEVRKFFDGENAKNLIFNNEKSKKLPKILRKS